MTPERLVELRSHGRGASKRAGYLKEALDEVERLVKENERLRGLSSARQDLLTCYRLGTRPPETLFKRLDRYVDKP